MTPEQRISSELEAAAEVGAAGPSLLSNGHQEGAHDGISVPGCPDCMTDSVIYRLPIVVTGYIQIKAEFPPVVVIDKYDWTYASWPRISPMGDDDTIVQVQVGDGRAFDADAELVEAIRTRASHVANKDTVWVVSETVDRDVTGRT